MVNHQIVILMVLLLFISLVSGIAEQIWDSSTAGSNAWYLGSGNQSSNDIGKPC